MMCKVNYFFCVNNDYPEKTRNQAYNNCQVPSLRGVEIFRFEDIFDGLDITNTHYVEVSIPSDAKIMEENRRLFVDRFIFINKTKLSVNTIKWMIDSGARVNVGPTNTGLIDWCIGNDAVPVLEHMANKSVYILKVMHNLINRFVPEEKYTQLINIIINSGYDIHKDGDSLFLFAASSKNTKLCRLLLKKGANIPKQVSVMYSVNEGLYPAMDKLLEEYKDRIIG